MPDKQWIYCPGSSFKPGWRLHSLPRGHGQPPKPLADFGLRGGLEVRTIGYFVAVFALVWITRRLPVVSIVVGIPPWWLAYLTLPALAAYKLTVFEPSGRPVRRWLGTMAEHYVMPRHRSAGRTLTPPGVPSIHEGLTAIATTSSDPVLRRCDVHGPATVTFRENVELVQRGGRSTIRRAPTNPTGNATGALVVNLDADERLRVRP